MSRAEQAEKDRHLGELIRALWDRRHYASVENLLDGGAACAFGMQKKRVVGMGDEPLDAAVELAAYEAGIMARAKTLPPRSEMPTLGDYKSVRGKD